MGKAAFAIDASLFSLKTNIATSRGPIVKDAFGLTAANNNEKTVPLGLALQGGGSYGAFTKGALKALLQSREVRAREVEIKAITGTSAGAMNGLMVAHGLNTAGPTRAIENLDGLWDDTGAGVEKLKNITLIFNPLAYSTWKMTTWPNWPQGMMSLGFAALPTGYVVGQLVDSVKRRVDNWDAVQTGSVKLFVNAVREDPVTRERGQRIFTGKGLTPDAFAAAVSLEALGPHKIEGADHYDGGYWRNPCFDDIEKEPITDLMIITIMEGPKSAITPTTQDEMRARHARPGREIMKSELYHHLAWMQENNKNLNLHVVGLKVDAAWDDTSRMNTDPSWLRTLEAMGHAAMQDWLRAHGDKLGKQSSYAIAAPNGAEPALLCAV